MPRFVPRERKHKKIARNQTASRPDSNACNAVTLLPETPTERDVRRNTLKEQLRAQQPESKGSSKKRKRLDKYVETKLKKEENAELVRKLGQSSQVEGQKIDLSLLRSSKKLGRVHESQRERLSRALREQRAGVGDGAVLLQARQNPSQVDDAASDSDGGDGPSEEAEIAEEDDGAATRRAAETVPLSFGSGLKRPLDVDEDGKPMIKKGKRRKVKHGVGSNSENGNVAHDEASDMMDQVSPHSEDEEEEWGGFSSQGEVDSTSSTHSEDEASESESSSVSSTSAQEDNAPRVSAFKAWADNLRNAALDFTPSSASATATPANSHSVFKPRAPSPDLIAMELTKSTLDSTPGSAITIPRSQEIQAQRLELPVVQEEQRIIEMVKNSPVTVICGATGSGKTTQVPQMLLENGYGCHIGGDNPILKHASESGDTSPSRGMIGVTQPRRVAATSVAARVQHELGSNYGKRVGHQVRYDTTASRDTAIKFMTDGILLREIQTDFLLSKYSVIVLDEAHERSVNTDILIGMLARIVPLRLQLAKETPDKHYPLKLTIMSATLSHGVNSFLQNEKLWHPLGGPPPVVSVEGRQFPVTVHFARKTKRDYVGDVVEKVVRGHRKLPPGGMLVFLTGQQEIQSVMQKLMDKIGGSGAVDSVRGVREGLKHGDEYEIHNPNDFLEGEEGNDSDSDAEVKIDDEEEEAEFVIPADPDRPQVQNVQSNGHLRPYILPLYAALPQSQQLKVFQPPSSGTRLIVLATNVAETSLTIPGIRYVIDCGRVKEKRYKVGTGSHGVQTFEVTWISKASAEQRKGRAGRTGPGHVWRLYSSNVYEEFFAEETVPEILRTELESVVLQLKAMEIENVDRFPFPTPPDVVALKKAEALLRLLGAIDDKRVTDVGREMMRFPVSPRYGKILLLAQRNDIVELAVALVAGLAVGDVFIPETHGELSATARRNRDSDTSEDGEVDETADKVATDARHQAYTRAQASLSRWDDRADAIKLLTTVAVYADSADRNTNLATFCSDFWLREKQMAEVQLLRRQLHPIVWSNGDMKTTGTPFADVVTPPSEKKIQMLKQVVAAGFIDRVAIRVDRLPNCPDGFGRKPRRAIEVAYRTLIRTGQDTGAAESSQEREIAQSVFVHPSSILAKLSPAEMPEYLVYSHLSRASPRTTAGDASQSDQLTSAVAKPKMARTRFHPLTPVSKKALALLAEGTPLLQIGKPIGKIEELPRDMRGVQRRRCWVGVGLKGPSAIVGSAATVNEWPLDPWKVEQRRMGGREWETERILVR